MQYFLVMDTFCVRYQEIISARTKSFTQNWVTDTPRRLCKNTANWHLIKPRKKLCIWSNYGKCTQSHWSCSKCHKSVRKVIKEIPFLFEFWQKIFFSALTTLEGERSFCDAEKRKRGQKSTTQNLLQLHKRPEEWFVQKKGKNVSLFLKTTFQVRKRAFGRLNFISCNCLLDQWNEKLQRKTFLDFLDFP